MKVRFWGVRGAIPARGGEFVRYGGNTACVSVEVDDRVLILDADERVTPELRREIESLLVSLGFPEHALDQAVEGFSGGERNIIGLARVLLDQGRAECIHLGSNRQRLAFEQLRGGVLGGDAFGRGAAFAPGRRQPQVDQRGSPIRLHDDVGGLDVAVQ